MHGALTDHKIISIMDLVHKRPGNEMTSRSRNEPAKQRPNARERRRSSLVGLISKETILSRTASLELPLYSEIHYLTPIFVKR